MLNYQRVIRMNSQGIPTLGEIDQHDTRIEGYSEPFWDHLLLATVRSFRSHYTIFLDMRGWGFTHGLGEVEPSLKRIRETSWWYFKKEKGTETPKQAHLVVRVHGKVLHATWQAGGSSSICVLKLSETRPGFLALACNRFYVLQTSMIRVGSCS